MGTITTYAPNISRLSSLAMGLAAATQNQDWHALHVLDSELATLLSDMQPAETWSPALAQAMTAVRHAHMEALMHCAMASEEMAARLSSTLSSKEGWMAYAANSDWNGSTP